MRVDITERLPTPYCLSNHQVVKRSPHFPPNATKFIQGTRSTCHQKHQSTSPLLTTDLLTIQVSGFMTHIKTLDVKSFFICKAITTWNSQIKGSKNCQHDSTPKLQCWGGPFFVAARLHVGCQPTSERLGNQEKGYHQIQKHNGELITTTCTVVSFNKFIPGVRHKFIIKL